MVALLVVLMVVSVLAVDWGLRAYRKRRGIMVEPRQLRSPLPEWAVLPLEALRFPAGLFYGRGHTWMKLSEAGEMLVGIDDFINHAIGPVEAVHFVDAGSRVRRGEPIARLQQGDLAVWVRSPISGRLVGTNEALDPAELRRDPYGAGWLARLEPDHPGFELATLKVGRQVSAWVKEEALRFGQFLAGQRSNLAVATLQDGGTLVERRLEALGPESAGRFDRDFLHVPEEA